MSPILNLFKNCETTCTPYQTAQNRQNKLHPGPWKKVESSLTGPVEKLQIEFQLRSVGKQHNQSILDLLKSGKKCPTLDQLEKGKIRQYWACQKWKKQPHPKPVGKWLNHPILDWSKMAK